MTLPLVLSRGRAPFTRLLSLPPPTPTFFSAAALYDPPQHVLIHGRHGDDVCEYPGESSTPLTLAAICVLSQQAGQVGVTEPLHSHVSLWIVATAVL